MSPRVSSTRPSADGCTLGVSTTAPPPGLCTAMSWPGGVGSGAAAAPGARTAAVTAVAAPIRAPAPSPRAVRGRRRHSAAAATAPTAATTAPTRTTHTPAGVGGGPGMATGMRATSGLATSTTSHAPGRSICKVPADGAPGLEPGASATSLVGAPAPTGTALTSSGPSSARPCGTTRTGIGPAPSVGRYIVTVSSWSPRVWATLTTSGVAPPCADAGAAPRTRRPSAARTPRSAAAERDLTAASPGPACLGASRPQPKRFERCARG